jgi:hypothetical protein
MQTDIIQAAARSSTVEKRGKQGIKEEGQAS